MLPLPQNPRCFLRPPTAADRDEFLPLMLASRDLHDPWVAPPTTPDAFDKYLASRQSPGQAGFLICSRQTTRILGVINLNHIVRSALQSAYLGYYIGAPYAHQGYMTEGLTLLIHLAFTDLQLHRLEANIQPDNLPSVALVRKLGFRQEGFSPRYLQIAGQWRDHLRFAILADEPSQ